MRPTAKQICEINGDGGRQAYATFGAVRPVMTFMDERGNGMLLHPHERLGDDPRIAYCEVVSRVARLYPWRFIGVVAEAWTKVYADHDEAQATTHGQLEAAAGTDPAVRTAIVAQTFNLRNRNASHAQLSTLIGELEWDIVEVPGVPEGELPAMILDTYRNAPRPDPPIAVPPISVIIDALIEARVAAEAILLAPGGNGD